MRLRRLPSVSMLWPRFRHPNRLQRGERKSNRVRAELEGPLTPQGQRPFHFPTRPREDAPMDRREVELQLNFIKSSSMSLRLDASRGSSIAAVLAPWTMLAPSDCLQFDTRKGGAANQLDRMRSYRDFRPAFFAGRRVAEVRRALRVGFAVAVFLEALRALAVFALGFVDCFFVVELFFFGDAAFAFRVVRLLAAPIAAPERAPITVPTTGTPSAVPATAPAAAPPRVLPAVPMPVLRALPSLSLSSIFLSPGWEKSRSLLQVEVSTRGLLYAPPRSVFRIDYVA